MATTKIWDIQTRLDNVIDYIVNEKKTNADSYYNLHRVVEYAKASYKTEEQLYVTAINCSEDTILQEMMETKKIFDKEDGILGYHAFQSFKEGEVTPEIAHKIGIKLAEEIWGDRFQVVVTTHLNTHCVHNHFVINSVSFVDGKKYYDNDETYALIRHTSDNLCREYGLSVLKEKPTGKYKIDYNKYFEKYTKKSNYHTQTKQDIDYAITQSNTYKEFENLLKAMNYELIYRAGKLSIRKEPYTKNIRVARAFGDDYTIEQIKSRIKTEKAIKLPFPEKRSNKLYIYKGKIKNKKKAKGIKALYLYYCYLLKIYPKTEKRRKTPISIKADVQKMERISEEARLLCSNDIKTTKELSLYMQTLDGELKNLEEERDKLYYQNTKLKKEERQENYTKLSQIAGKIQYLKHEIKKCKEIEARVPKIKQNLKELDEKEKIQKGKEKKDYEYIK
ncbi:MAG: relaxase/mobilization nuclease domain-containing protein [Clostridium sp.]|nr:relaxase/mobilization nuclease domain-containing protein [Clostridium sp.]MEE0768416.1 relaxase/mobilization nuclease domain-containing protein [Clostridia bacterium]